MSIVNAYAGKSRTHAGRLVDYNNTVHVHALLHVPIHNATVNYTHVIKSVCVVGIPYWSTDVHTSVGAFTGRSSSNYTRNSSLRVGGMDTQQ